MRVIDNNTYYLVRNARHYYYNCDSSITSDDLQSVLEHFGERKRQSLIIVEAQPILRTPLHLRLHRDATDSY